MPGSRGCLRMVAFGPTPAVPAHAQRGNPLLPKRDTAAEASHRGPAPPVPRAPRAQPKAQSAGALTREWRRSSSVDVSTRSETRRPREGSPFSTLSASSSDFKRVSSLTREVNAPENQRFEMGPCRPPSAERRDHKRNHLLQQENEANVGIPWGPTPAASSQDRPSGERDRARKNTLGNEHKAADQALEWAPTSGLARPSGGARVNQLEREEKALVGEFLSGAARNASKSGGDGLYGRKNIIAREFTSEQSVDMPRASRQEGVVPGYNRQAKLERENPVGFRSAAS